VIRSSAAIATIRAAGSELSSIAIRSGTAEASLADAACAAAADRSLGSIEAKSA
jgi:hypothetical protein